MDSDACFSPELNNYKMEVSQTKCTVRLCINTVKMTLTSLKCCRTDRSLLKCEAEG